MISLCSTPALMTLEPVLERILSPNNLSHEITITHINLVTITFYRIRIFQTFKGAD